MSAFFLALCLLAFLCFHQHDTYNDLYVMAAPIRKRSPFSFSNRRVIGLTLSADGKLRDALGHPFDDPSWDILLSDQNSPIPVFCVGLCDGLAFQSDQMQHILAVVSAAANKHRRVIRICYGPC